MQECSEKSRPFRAHPRGKNTQTEPLLSDVRWLIKRKTNKENSHPKSLYMEEFFQIGILLQSEVDIEQNGIDRDNGDQNDNAPVQVQSMAIIEGKHTFKKQYQKSQSKKNVGHQVKTIIPGATGDKI